MALIASLLIFKLKITSVREEGPRVGSCLVALYQTLYNIGRLCLSMLLKINKIFIYSGPFPVAGRLNVFGKDMVETCARTIGG